MTQHLPRFHAHHQHIDDQRKLARILLKTGEALPIQTVTTDNPSERNLRYLLLGLLRQRDGDNCYLCHKPLTPGFTAIDHIVPLARGGKNEHWNVALSCTACNIRKATSIVSADITTQAPIYRDT